MNYDRLVPHVEKAIFVLLATSMTVYISGYHPAKSLLLLQLFLAIFLFIPKPGFYLSGFSRVDAAWLSTLLLYPFSYYLAFIVHERSLNLTMGNDMLINSLIGISLYLIIRKTDYFTLERFCRYTAISIAFAGTVVVWQWVANDFQGRWTTGTNIILSFACVASAATMMCFWYLIHNKENMWVKMGVFYAGAIGLASVFAAGARGALLAIMALFILYMFVGLLKKKLALLVIPVLVVGVSVLWVMQADMGNKMFKGIVAGIEKSIETGEIKDNSLDLRVQAWRAAVEVIKEHPVLGVGNGTLKETFPGAIFEDKNVSMFGHVHNEIFQAWSALGVFGLISILVLIAIPIWAGVSHQSPATPYLIIIAVAFGINGLTDVPFMENYSFKYYAMVVGLLLIIHQKNLIRSA